MLHRQIPSSSPSTSESRQMEPTALRYDEGSERDRGPILHWRQTTLRTLIRTPIQRFKPGCVMNMKFGDNSPAPDCATAACRDSSGTHSTAYGSDAADDTANTNGRTQVKQFIDQNPDAKGVIMVGHVTVPFAGAANASDGHCNHSGAWVADAWY